MPVDRRRTRERGWVLVAAAAGTLHALASLYWALGGGWLLASVGQWAVDLSARRPLLSGAVLGAVAVAKLAAAVVPVAVAYGRLPARWFWRGVAWVGGPFHALYGRVNVVVSVSVLAGLVRPAGGYDREAMVGHAFVWDPLFLVWGAALTLSLWVSRDRR